MKEKMPETKEMQARQVCVDDFYHFDFILCMDKENLADLKRIQPKDGKGKLALLGSYDPQGKKEVDDPYYGGKKGFEINFNHILRCCKALIKEVENK